MFSLPAFSIQRKPMFVLLVIGLALFSVGSWWSVKTLIDADLQSRLNSQYLPMIIGFGAAFISSLILIVLKASQNQLIFEAHSRELSRLAAERSRVQMDLLQRLNDSAEILSGELDLDALAEKFFKLTSELARSSKSFLYLSSESKKTFETRGAPLAKIEGFARESLLKSSFTLQDLGQLMSNRIIVAKADPGASEVLVRLFKTPPQLADWLLLGLPSRETGLCGLIFLARTDGPGYDEAEREIIESLVTQALGAIENAKLLKKAEDSNLAKTAFVANMSHEIRTPLNAVIGFSELMIKKDLSESQRNGFSINLRKSGEQLTRIIDDILDLSKIEAGKLSIEKKPVQLATLTRELQSLVEIRSREKGIRFTIESVDELPEHIETDEIRLKQILMNLIGNAIKFTESGSVTLRIGALERDFISFQIRDTGIGISEEAQRELFQPFSQVDNSSTRKFGGSGLGLALSRRLSQQLGGDLNLIESVPGQGSIFELRLTAGDLHDVEWTSQLLELTKGEKEEPVSLQPRARLDRNKILLVEDSVDNQEIFRFFLESAGAKIDIVDNGLAAVERAATGDYDIILMDIQIPEIDGKEATRRIRRQGFTRPIIALTAHGMLEERESCLAAGCTGQITKPVSEEALISEVAHYVRRSHAAPTSIATLSH
jgi:signal transduction histidine kinase